MSQEKVDKYKQEKANRKKTIAKEKRKKKLYTALAVLIGVVFIGWLGVSVYLEIKQAKEDESMEAELSKWLEDYYATSTNATTGDGSATTTTGSDTTSGSESETTSGDTSSDETTSSGETTTGDETTSQNETTSEEETTSQEETTTTATE